MVRYLGNGIQGKQKVVAQPKDGKVKPVPNAARLDIEGVRRSLGE